MLAVALGLLAYFRRKGWLGARHRPDPPKPEAR